MSYRPVVIAISAGLQHQHLPGNLSAEEIADEMLGRQVCMPDYLRFPMRFATLLFDLCGIFSGGRLFRAKNNDARAAQLDSWKHSSIGACRNFVRFYESLFLLIALQEEPR
jgi:hypothetical protein